MEYFSKNRGRGRPKMDPSDRKVIYTTRLKPFILKWLRKHPMPASQLIETALENTFPEIKDLE